VKQGDEVAETVGKSDDESDTAQDSDVEHDLTTAPSPPPPQVSTSSFKYV